MDYLCRCQDIALIVPKAAPLVPDRNHDDGQGLWITTVGFLEVAYNAIGVLSSLYTSCTGFDTAVTLATAGVGGSVAKAASFLNSPARASRSTGPVTEFTSAFDIERGILTGYFYR